jgi:uncharacterized protein YkwD
MPLLSSPLRRCIPLVLGILVLVAACGPGNQMAADDTALVNQLRVNNGLGALPRSYELDLKAQSQAQAMANAGTIFHSPSLVSGVSPGWQLIGENVAMAGSIAQAEAALEASPPHRENLLNPHFTEMGIGAVQAGNLVFVAQVFVQR